MNCRKRNSSSKILITSKVRPIVPHYLSKALYRICMRIKYNSCTDNNVPFFISQAGTTLQQLTSASDALTVWSVLLLVGFAVISMLPVCFRDR